MKPAIFVIPAMFLAAVAAIVAVQATGAPRAVEAAGARLELPHATCSGSTAKVEFSWFNFAGETQWLDVSTNESFAPGTFTGYGPLSNTATSFTVESLPSTTVHYWRINTLGPTGWTTSDTGVFVPCGAPQLLWGPLSCEGRFRARVDFRWAPVASGIEKQYIDVSYDPSFAPGSFIGRQHAPITSKYTWSSLQANTPTFFRINALDQNGVWRTSPVAGFTADCAPPVRQGLYHSGDRLIVPSIGVNAPVNVRDVVSGAMGDPEGPYDVVRYTFPLNEGFGGYPGDGGTTLIAGHLDWRNLGLAVFGHLERLAPGDVIDYVREDGSVISYQVAWVEDVRPDYNFGELARNYSTEAVVLITCNGTFDWGIEEYSHRRVVYATKTAAVYAGN